MRNYSSAIPQSVLNSIQAGSLRFTYRGIPMLKNPFDLSLYSKLLFDLKPQTIIEIGTYRGGSALWFADTMTAYGVDARVLSIDIDPAPAVQDGRIAFLRGDALKLGDVMSTAMIAAARRPILVVDDGAHTYGACLATLRFFGSHLRSGEYFVMEDGIIDDLPVDPNYDYGQGPNGAIRDFLAESGEEFAIDETYCDFFGHNFTWNTNGYLKRL